MLLLVLAPLQPPRVMHRRWRARAAVQALQALQPEQVVEADEDADADEAASPPTRRKASPVGLSGQ